MVVLVTLIIAEFKQGFVVEMSIVVGDIYALPTASGTNMGTMDLSRPNQLMIIVAQHLLKHNAF